MTGDEPTVIEWVAPAATDQWCWCCGGRRGKNESEDAWTVDRNRGEEPRGVKIDGGRATALEPAWSRRHTSCQPTAWYLIEQISGETVDGLTRADVETIAADTDVKLSAVAADWTGRRPWGWVTDGDRGRLRVAIERVRRAHDPQPHDRGRCALCGVGSALSWSTRFGGWDFRDGSPSAVCGDCAASVEVLGSLEADRIRTAAVCRLAGIRYTPVLLPLARRWKAFSEVAADTEKHSPAARAWTYRRERLGRLAEEARDRVPAMVLDLRRRALAEARYAALHAAATEADRRGDQEDDEHGW